MSTSTKNTTDWFNAACLILLATYLTKLSRDLILPSLPAIAASLQASQTTIALNVSVYFFGIALSRLIWPSLSDSFSRRDIALLCISLFISSTALTAVAPNAFLFLLGRFAQAFFIAGLPLITRAQIFGDNGLEKTIQLFATISLFSAWAPAVATGLGGYIQRNTFWQVQFIVLAALGILSLIAIFLLSPERTTAKSKPLSDIIPAYFTICKDSAFWRIALPFSLLTALLAVYFTISPFLFINYYGLSEEAYGLLTFFLIAGMTLGMFCSGQLTKQFSIQHIVRLGTYTCLGASLLLLFIIYLQQASIPAVMSCLSLFAFGMGLLNPTVKTQVMALHVSNAATVLAVLGLVEAFISMLAAAIAALLSAQHVLPMALLLSGLAVTASLIVFYSPLEKCNE